MPAHPYRHILAGVLVAAAIGQGASAQTRAHQGPAPAPAPTGGGINATAGARVPQPQARPQGSAPAGTNLTLGNDLLVPIVPEAQPNLSRGNDLLEPLVPEAQPNLSLGNDLLEPLVPEEVPNLTLGNDLLEPLVPEIDPLSLGNDLLEPLVPEPASTSLGNDLVEPLEVQSDPSLSLGNDLLEPLAPNEPTPEERARVDAMLQSMGLTLTDAQMQALLRDAKERLDQKAREPRNTPRSDLYYVIPRDLDYTDYLQVQDQQDREERKTVMVRRVRIDPCGDFEVSWGGRKTCHPRERIYYELAFADEPPEADETDEDNGAEEPDWGFDYGPGGPSNAPGTASSNGPSGPRGSAPGSAPGGPGPTGAPGGGAAAGSAPGASGGGRGSIPGGFVGPDRTGSTRFEIRLESAVVDPLGYLDVRLSLTAPAGGPVLLTETGWTATAATGSVIATSGALWTPTTGAPVAFPLMPLVSAGDRIGARFLITLQPGQDAVSTLSIRQPDGFVAVFDLSADPRVMSRAGSR